MIDLHFIIVGGLVAGILSIVGWIRVRKCKFVVSSMFLLANSLWSFGVTLFYLAVERQDFYIVQFSRFLWIFGLFNIIMVASSLITRRKCSDGNVDD